MHLAVQTLPFDEPLESTVEFLADLGVESIDWRCEPDDYLDDPEKQEILLETVAERDVTISMLGATGYNPLHPVDERADEADERLRKTIRLADQLGVDVVSSFSGLPGATPDDRSPNWIATPVPPGRQHEYYEYQWEDVAIPYWEELGEYADGYGIDVAIEIHVNTLVNSPATMRTLRRETHERIGGYLDPGHLWLQEIDPVESVRYLAEDDAIFHVEASDVRRNDSNLAVKGTWDMTPLDDALDRSWSFCPVGYGHGEETWRDIISTLDLVGYDGPVSIQQLNTPEDLHGGIEKGAAFLDQIII
ncbi:sugar phosphate isomerase/epimerase family protein [Halosolutus gelatinilyticus]|uniref:sugar phosphate isomerase/epimerase family protein n=1 Tax=Halosolutus gelatinilyticus TaxID=2931975 RepID=UPI001FF29FF9|nr:sugar phosphate isomerase/epimerase [Halosolutus gelatinilyticus]